MYKSAITLFLEAGTRLVGTNAFYVRVAILGMVAGVIGRDFSGPPRPRTVACGHPYSSHSNLNLIF